MKNIKDYNLEDLEEEFLRIGRKKIQSTTSI